MKRALLFFSFVICCFSVEVKLEAQSNMWVTYYNDVWSRPPVSELDFSAITHVLTGVGCMEPSQSSPYYTITDWDQTYETALLTAAHAAGRKVILELGSIADNYDYICQSQGSGGRLDTYVNNVTSYAQSHGYDGVDVDWEFPWGGSTAQEHGELMKRLRAKLDTWSPRGILTIAVGNANASDYNISALSSYVDQINMMGYDLAGYWLANSGFNSAISKPSDCPGYDAEVVSTGVSVWTSAVPASKVGLGVSFMGYKWDGITSYCQNASNGGGRTYYSDIVAGANYLNQGTYHWQTQGQVPYLTHTNPSWFLSYDDPQSLTAKVDYAKQHNMGGIMIWQQGGYVASLPSGQRNPLLQAIKDAVGSTLEPPAAPTLSSPSDGATGVSVTPTLSWNSSSGATSYQLQVSTISSFSSTVVNQTGITATSYSVSLSGNATYYWRVSASNVAGTSSWSSSRSFTTGAPPPPPSAPTLASPADGATGVSAAPTLSWNASSGATSYQLQVSLNSSFSTTVANQSGITTTSYVATGLTSNTTYYWRANATNAGGTSAWSSSRSFTTAAVSADGLIAAYSFDEGSGTVLNDLSFSGHNGTVNGATWSTSGKYNGDLSFSGTSNYVATTLPISTLSSGFTITAWVLCDPTVSDWAWVIGEDTGGFFFIGKSANGNYIHAGAGGILDAQDFTGSTITTGSWQHLAWTWDGTTSASGIKIYINGNLTSQARATGTSFVATTNFRVGARNPGFGEYWKGMIDEIRIYSRSLSQADVQNAMNTPVGQTTSSPNAPTLSSPAAGATGVASNPTLGWNASTGASSYGLQVSTSSSFSSMVVNQTGITTTSYAVSGLANNTTYYWRVNATNTGGTSAYSTAWSFTTSGATPSSPTLSSPLSGTTGVSITPTLIWNASTGATSYRLQISTSSSFATTVVNQSGITSTSYAPSGLIGNTTYYWRVNATNASGTSAYSTTWSFTTSMSHSIVLSPGPNLISSVVLPRNSTLDTLLAKIMPHMGQYDVMKNSQGQVFWPALSVNQIGTWNYLEGYQIFVQSAETLTATGSEIVPEATPIPLPLQGAGVNIVPYLRHTPMRADSALAGILNILVIAKNNAGQVYWPSQGTNQIGSMKPGQGYQVQVTQASTLIYPANTTPGPPSVLAKQQGSVNATEIPSPVHYQPTASRTGANAVLLVEAPELKEGDEIAIWTASKMLVGSSVMSGRKALITVWGDNIATQDVTDGAVEGEPLSLTFWSAAEQNEGSLTVSSLLDALTATKSTNSVCYRTNAVWIAQAIQVKELPKEFSLSQNYPNPFNPSTIIQYALPNEAMVTLEVFNILGQRVALPVNEQQKAGNHEAVFQNSTLGSGIYFYRLTAGEFTATKKMVLIR